MKLENLKRTDSNLILKKIKILSLDLERNPVAFYIKVQRQKKTLNIIAVKGKDVTTPKTNIVNTFNNSVLQISPKLSKTICVALKNILKIFLIIPH